MRKLSQCKAFNFIFICLLFLLSFLFCFIFIHSFFSESHFGLWASNDYIAHARAGVHFFDYLRSDPAHTFELFLSREECAPVIMYPLWHLLVQFTYFALQLFFTEINEFLLFVAVSLTTSFLVVVFQLAVFCLFRHYTKCSDVLCYVLSLICCLVGPLDASKYLNSYYLGGYSCNLWHSPTYIAVKPIALVVFFLYGIILNNTNVSIKFYILTSLAFLFSAVAKPSFYQMFLPALVVFCAVSFLINRTKTVFIHYLKVAISCVPVLCYALLQLSVIPSAGNGTLGFKPFYVWSYFTPNWPLSLLVSVAFPLFTLTITRFHRKFNTFELLAFATFFCSFFEYSFLYIQAMPFNADLSWSFALSLLFLFAISIYDLVMLSSSNSTCSRLRLLPCWMLLFLHVINGLRWIAYIYNTGEFFGPLMQ